MITAVLSQDSVAVGLPPRTLRLREITAAEELAATSAAALIATLALPGGTAAPDELTLSEQDMAIAALYRALYGDTIECRVHCLACDRPFEVGFEIGDWIAALWDAAGPEVERIGVNRFAMHDPRVLFRLPTAADLMSIASLPDAERAAELRRRCVSEGDVETPALEAAMARAGPLLDDEIEATCPRCDAAQRFALRLDTYLRDALRRERPVILREVHHVAACYHWPRAEILALPRSERRDFVRLILADHGRTGASAWH